MNGKPTDTIPQSVAPRRGEGRDYMPRERTTHHKRNTGVKNTRDTKP